MVDAVRHATHAVEQRAQFLEEALEARAEMGKSGQGYQGDDVRGYLRARLINVKPANLSPRYGGNRLLKTCSSAKWQRARKRLEFTNAGPLL